MATILVVDDEPDLRQIWRAFLERAGHEVLDAASGEDALVTLAQAHPDAMLLDLRMEGIGGWGVLETLGTERLDALPVVVISAQVDGTAAQRARDLGCRAFLTKPFSRTDLMAVLDQVLTPES